MESSMLEMSDITYRENLELALFQGKLTLFTHPFDENIQASVVACKIYSRRDPGSSPGKREFNLTLIRPGGVNLTTLIVLRR